MTVVITASTDKNHNSVITVKDQYGKRSIDLPMLGSDMDRFSDQSGEQPIGDHSTLSEPLAVSHDPTSGSDTDRSADQSGDQSIDDHFSMAGPLVLNHDVGASDPPTTLIEHEDKPSVPVEQESKPSIPVHEEDQNTPLVPMKVDIDDSLLPPSTRLQRYLKETDELIVCPGVYDGFSARIAISVGYKAMYMVCCVYPCPQNGIVH